jgi:hypothetical protein
VSAADDRKSLGSAAIVPPSVAAAWLPFNDADAIRWLRARGLVHKISVPDETGELRVVEVVIWGEVIEEVQGKRSPAAQPPKQRSNRPPVLPYSDPDE